MTVWVAPTCRVGTGKLCSTASRRKCLLCRMIHVCCAATAQRRRWGRRSSSIRSWAGCREVNVESAQPSSQIRFAALRYRNFSLLWSGLIVSNMGTWMQNVANGWLVLQLTNSPVWLGLLGLSFALPMILIPPFAGTVVDRRSEEHTSELQSPTNLVC